MRDSLRTSDRAAIYSTSGQTGLEFTDDRDRLRGTLFTLQPRPVARSMVQECPDVSYYMGDLIQNHNDPMALDAATREAMVCAHLDPNSRSAAESMARCAASRAITAGGHETRLALGMVRDVVRRMAATPGQRVIVLASPGFITSRGPPGDERRPRPRDQGQRHHQHCGRARVVRGRHGHEPADLRPRLQPNQSTVRP